MNDVEVEVFNLSELCVPLSELCVRSLFNAENAEKDAEYTENGDEILLE